MRAFSALSLPQRITYVAAGAALLLYIAKSASLTININLGRHSIPRHKKYAAPLALCSRCGASSAARSQACSPPSLDAN